MIAQLRTWAWGGVAQGDQYLQHTLLIVLYVEHYMLF